MGRGDKRTTKGKMFKGSFGKTRLRKKRRVATTVTTAVKKKT